MKKFFTHLKRKWYRRLAERIENYIPKEYQPIVVIIPSSKKDEDLVTISLRVPHKMTKKLMWSLKVWREN